MQRWTEAFFFPCFAEAAIHRLKILLPSIMALPVGGTQIGICWALHAEPDFSGCGEGVIQQTRAELVVFGTSHKNISKIAR